MPPKASLRRTTRGASREPEPAPRERPGQFVRPHLPALAGTPGARRQYTYGSALEPPRRPATGSQRVDISQAVDDALQRRPADIDDGGFARPPVPEARSVLLDDEDDEPTPRPRTTRRTGAIAIEESTIGAGRSTAQNPRNSTTVRNTVPGSDADSLRSFNMESDYYGDATIASTPGVIPAPEALREASDNRGLKRSSKQKQLSKSSPEETTHTRPTAVSKGRPVRPGVGQGVGRTRPQQPPQSSSDSEVEAEENETEEQVEAEAEEEEESEDEEYDPANPALGHQQYTNTPLPKRSGLTSSRTLRLRRGPPQMGAEDDFPIPRRSKSSEANSAAVMARVAAVKDFEPTTDFGSGSNTNDTQSQPATQSLFGKSRKSPWGRPSGGAFSSFLSTRPGSTQLDAIQKEVLEAQEQLEREEREQRLREEGLTPWGERWARIWWYLTLQFLRHRRTRQEEELGEYREDLGADVVPLGTSWLRLINPLTYMSTAIWILDMVMDHVISLIDKISLPSGERVQRRRNLLRWLLLAIIGLSLGLGAFRLVSLLSAVSTPSFSVPSLGLPSFPSTPRIPAIGLPKFGGITDKIGVPSFSWPLSSAKAGDSKSTEKKKKKAKNDSGPYANKYDQELERLKKTEKIHQGSLNRLEALMPQIISMDSEKGKPIVGQDFWHALRDLMHADDTILTLENKGWGSGSMSDSQWQNVVKKLVDDPAFNSKINATVSDFYDGRMVEKTSGAWESWIKKNDDKVLKILGPKFDKIKASGSSRQFDEKVFKSVKDVLKSKDLKQIIVTRDEFLKHLKSEFVKHRKEIRDELNQLRPGLEKLIRDSAKVASADPPRGMTREEMETLINTIVRRHISNINLDAMAKGKIKANWHDQLKAQINYFNVGSGATIDQRHTSPPFITTGKLNSEKSFKKGIAGVDPELNSARKALEPWEDEGDCFCAVRTSNRRGNPSDSSVVVRMAYWVIPEKIVIEHINPAASNHPDARPKDIEVWAWIEDEDIRERVRDFSATHFPEDTENWNYKKPDYDEHFVKISQFVYEGAEANDGIYIHSLSSELLSLNAATSQVAIRAVSNYGSEKQTCFYRLRLFGQPVDYTGQQESS